MADLKRHKSGILIFLMLMICPVICFSASTYFNRPQYTAVIDYGLNSNELLLDYPICQPYSNHELLCAIKDSKSIESKSNHWNRLLKAEINRFYSPRTDTSGYWHIGANAGYRTLFNDAGSRGRFRLEAEGTYQSNYLVLCNRTVIDQSFKDDPLFYGDTREWIWGRSEDAYLLLQFKNLSFFAGRLSKNLGMQGEPSLILSDNPYSYDHFEFKYTSKRFRFIFMTARLNNEYGFDSKESDTTQVLAKRYFSLQRGDLKLRDNLYIGLNQVAIYGGENRTFEAIYLNPMNLYYVAQRNNRSSISGLWALDCYWKPKSNVTLWGQLLIDDIIVNNEPGQDDRAVHPDRFGWTLKGSVTDWLVPYSQIDITYNHVDNWTYMSYRTWENYVFQKKSMGFPYNSYEGWRLKYTYLGNPPFIYKGIVNIAKNGEQDINQVFGDRIEKFPRGIVENQTLVEMSVTYVPSWKCYGELSLSYVNAGNQDNRVNNDDSYFKALFTLYASTGFNFHF